jgi:hypothetical protein
MKYDLKLNRMIDKYGCVWEIHGTGYPTYIDRTKGSVGMELTITRQIPLVIAWW